VHSRAEARAALLWLKQHNKKVSKATHNMVAWRIVENGVLMQGISNQISLIF
jgi:putative IMPACT (imprinted ancient) family translation regulator